MRFPTPAEVLTAANYAATAAKAKIEKNSLSHFKKLQTKWREAVIRAGLGADSQCYHDIFALTDDHIADIKIPENLKKIQPCREGDGYGHYRKLIKQANDSIQGYLKKGLMGYKEGTGWVFSYFRTTLAGNIYAMQVIEYLLNYVAPYNQVSSDEGLKHSIGLLEIIIDFLQTYSSDDKSYERLPACQQAIDSLKLAKKELIRIHDNKSGRDLLTFIAEKSLIFAQSCLNLAVKMVYPHVQLINRDTEISAELLSTGTVYKRDIKSEEAIDLPSSLDLFMGDEIKNIASYIHKTETIGDEKNFSIPEIPNIIYPKEKQIYQDYLDLLYTIKEKGALKASFFSIANYRPYYFGIKILPVDRKSGRSASWEFVTAEELKKQYDLIYRLLKLTISATNLSMLAHASAGVVQDEGQINFFTEDYYDHVFILLKNIAAELRLNFNTVNQEMDAVTPNLDLLHDKEVNKTTQAFNRLQIKIAEDQKSILKEMLKLFELKEQYRHKLPKVKVEMLDKIMEVITKAQGSCFEPTVLAPSEISNAKSSLVQEKDINERQKELQSRVIQNEQDYQSLKKFAGYSITGLVSLLSLAFLIGNDQQDNDLLKGLRIAAGMGIVVIPALWSYLCQNEKETNGKISLSASRDNIYNEHQRTEPAIPLALSIDRSGPKC